MGDKFTMADVCAFPLIAFMVRSGAKLTDFPALKQYYDAVCARPSVQATWPPHWKESPSNTIMGPL